MAFLTFKQKAPLEIKEVANYLRNAKKSELKARPGVLNGKRVEFFKGMSI